MKYGSSGGICETLVIWWSNNEVRPILYIKIEAHEIIRTLFNFPPNRMSCVQHGFLIFVCVAQNSREPTKLVHLIRRLRFC